VYLLKAMALVRGCALWVEKAGGIRLGMKVNTYRKMVKDGPREIPKAFCKQMTSVRNLALNETMFTIWRSQLFAGSDDSEPQCLILR